MQNNQNNAPKVVTFEGKSYEVESMPEAAVGLFNDVAIVEDELKHLARQTGIAQIAKASLLDKFRELTPSMTEVVSEKEETKPTPPAPKKRGRPKKTS